MRVKIGKRIYDTSTAQEVGRQTVSFFGDPYGFEEIMFQKDGGREYFLLARGGELSQYASEEIIPLVLSDARAWLMRITGEAHANYLIPEESVSQALEKEQEKQVKKSQTVKEKKQKAAEKDKVKAEKAQAKAKASTECSPEAVGEADELDSTSAAEATKKSRKKSSKK